MAKRIKTLEKQIAAGSARVSSIKPEYSFQTFTEQSPNMIFISKGGRVVYANKRCSEIMGDSREKFYSPGFDFMTLIAPESFDLFQSNFKRHMSGEDIVPYEYVLLDKKGHKIEAIITTKLIDYADGKAILGIITDITERKRVEKELQYRLKFQHLITTVSSQFVNLHPAQIDDEIDDALPKIAELPMRTAVMFSNSPMTKNPYPAPMNGVLRESRQLLTVFKMRRWTHIHGR